MINREVGTTLSNSIAFNILNDNLVAKNYLALAYCIAGVKANGKRSYPGITTACRAFGLLENSNKSSVIEERKESLNLEKLEGPREYKKRLQSKVIVTNTLTNEEIEYDSSQDVIKELGVSPKSIHSYIYNGTRFKGIYQLRYSDMPKHKLKPTRTKSVKCTNEITGEVIVFDAMKDAAKYLDVGADHMTYLAKSGKKSKTGWRVEKI